MSNQPKNEGARRRDEETRLSMSHLAGGPTSANTNKDDEDDEDWGDMPNKSAPVSATVTTKPKGGTDEDLDRELEDEDLKEDEDEEDEDLKEDEDEEEGKVTKTTFARETAPAVQREEATQASFDASAELQSLERLQNNLPALIKALEQQKESINESRRKLDEQEKALNTRINFIRVLSGQAPLTEATKDKEEDDEDEKPSAPRRRGGRRRKAAVTPSDDDDDDDKETSSEEKGGRGGKGGKREKNNQTLKEAIMRSLFTMKHPTTQQEYTGFVNDITKKVTREQGYKTTSEKPTNTVRIQMYRLEDDKMAKQNEDGSYTLRKKGIEWVQENGISAKKDSDD